MPVQHLKGQLDLVEWIEEQRMNRCPTCGQEIGEYREGVRLSVLKARLFDAILRAGADGIEGNDLFDMLLKERGAGPTVLKTHVYQINEKLAGTDCSIEVTRNGRAGGTYRVKRTKGLK
jgi:hypothetical protein